MGLFVRRDRPQLSVGAMTKRMITVNKIGALPEDLPILNDRAENEGFRFLTRLVQEFDSGTNTFARPGEALFEVRDQERLIGVGGLNIDPYHDEPHIGRVRRLYIDPDYRRQGIGRSLMSAIEKLACGSFSELRLRTDTIEGAQFYENLGYRRIHGAKHSSHAKTL